LLKVTGELLLTSAAKMAAVDAKNAKNRRMQSLLLPIHTDSAEGKTYNPLADKHTFKLFRGQI
jgi:hypothetical protein